jgi:xylulokinase
MTARGSEKSAPLLVGLDMGSTNVKAVVYEPDGRAVAKASVPAITHYPQPTWAFYEPDELWELAVTVVRDAVAQVDHPGRIVGIAVASVGESGIPIDAQGDPTYYSIAWFDRRTVEQADWLAREIGEERIFAVSGVSLQNIFALCKLLWIKQHQPDAFQRTARWLHVADYIAYKLSGVGATDWSLASRTMMFDVRKHDWDAGILTDAGIPLGLPAPTAPSGTKIGRITTAASNLTGLPTSCIVTTGGHDHVCGSLGAGAVRHGQVLDSMGTAEALFLALDAPMSDPALGHMGYAQGAHAVEGKYYVFGGLYTSGACVDWAHRLVGKDLDRAVLLAEAAQAPVGSLGVGFIPHLRLANPPHSDGRARAGFVGLTSDVERGTLFRSVLEGICFGWRASLEPLVGFAKIERPTEIIVIGGSSKNDLLLRIKAAVNNIPLKVMDLEEATALGAAVLAGLGAGIYRDVDDAMAQIEAHPTTIEADPEWAEFYDRYFNDVYKSMYDALRPLNHRIHALVDPQPGTGS